jgi:hypothetical protein
MEVVSAYFEAVSQHSLEFIEKNEENLHSGQSVPGEKSLTQNLLNTKHEY